MPAGDGVPVIFQTFYCVQDIPIASASCGKTKNSPIKYCPPAESVRENQNKANRCHDGKTVFHLEHKGTVQHPGRRIQKGICWISSEFLKRQPFQNIPTVKLEGSIKMKRVICALLAVLMLASFAGCGKAENSKSPCAQGIEVITMMTEMSENEQYLDALSGSQELKNQVLHIGTKTPEAPEIVYEVKVDEDAVLQMLNLSDLEGFSEDLQNNLRSRIYSMIASQINATEGVTALAASSACTASKAFLNDQMSDNTLFLYLYEDGAPVLVSFTTSGDGIVSVTGSFLFKDTSDLSKETVTAWFENYAGDLQVVAGS